MFIEDAIVPILRRSANERNFLILRKLFGKTISLNNVFYSIYFIFNFLIVNQSTTPFSNHNETTLP